MTANALLALFFLAAPVDDVRTYDLKLDPKPVVGVKISVTQEEKLDMKLRLLMGGEEGQRQDAATRHHTNGEIEFLEVVDGVVLKEAGLFTKASYVRDGAAGTYGFEGKRVEAARKSKDAEFDYFGPDGKPLIGTELEGIKRSFPSREDGYEIFAPKKAVKVGEPWTVDLARIVEMFAAGAKAEDACDLEKSTSKMTLVSVEPKEGGDWGSIQGTCKLHMKRFGMMELKQPLEMKLDIELHAFIDGDRFDGDLRVKMQMVGVVGAKLAGLDGVEVDLNLRVDKAVSVSQVPSIRKSTKIRSPK